jgi:non-reducing end alpha-L-arabinofuranosidase
MQKWVGLRCVVVLAGGIGIVGSGCHASVGVVPKDAGVPPDVAVSSGGVVGASTEVGSTGAGGTGGLTTNDGLGGSAAGGASGTVLVDPGTGGFAGAGGAGGAGGAETGRPDAGAPDAPVSGGASGTTEASGGDSAPGSGGGAPGSGGAAGFGGRTNSGGSAAGGSTGSGGVIGSGGSTGLGGSTSPDARPCDIYASGNTPCVAAYSMVRALLRAYSGNLYQVKKADGTVKDIGVLAPGGFANATVQDAFCGTDACTVSILYDQSGKGNHLTKAPPGCYTGTKIIQGNESDAKGRSLMVGGRKAYALYMIPGDGYRNNKTTGMPIDAQAQGIYEVVDGTRNNGACCWDFGNARIDNCNGSIGNTNALFFGTAYWGKGAGSGPWFMADFETVWAGGSGLATAINPDSPSATYDYAMGILKTNATNYAIRVGNAQSGSLVTTYDGALPFSTWAMKGGIILGISGDVSNSSLGTFFEGAITFGRPTDATDTAVLQNAQAAGYGK